MGYQNKNKQTPKKQTKKHFGAGLKQFLMVALVHFYPRRNSPKTFLRATQGYYFGGFSNIIPTSFSIEIHDEKPLPAVLC